MDPNDRAAVRAVLAGDRNAYGDLVIRHSSRLFRLAYRMVGSEADADDVVQDTFLRGYLNLAKFEYRSNFSTWIYRITVTRSLDHLRRKKRKKRFAFVESLFGKNDELINDPPDFVHPGVVAEKKEDAATLFKAIAELPENQNTAFVLNKVEGLSYQQISEIMQMSESAVDSLLHRAKMNLRKKLQNYYANSQSTKGII